MFAKVRAARSERGVFHTDNSLEFVSVCVKTCDGMRDTHADENSTELPKTQSVE